MSRTTFYHILDEISDQIEKQRAVEEPISPDFRLAVTIYKLSRGDYIYTIGELCGLAKATVCTIVSETCKVIVDTLWNDTLKSISHLHMRILSIAWKNSAKNGNFPMHFRP